MNQTKKSVKPKRKPTVLELLSLLIFIQSVLLGGSDTFEDLKQSYQFSNQLNGWEASALPQVFRGDDLFLFINGGADLYQEYGFIQAMSLEYRKKQNRSINVEIYEMSDAKSAYGIFTSKTGKGGKKMAIGHEARLEDYYLNVWQGNFLVTLIGFDSHPETVDGLVTIARAVAKKIKSKKPDYPLLTRLLPFDHKNNCRVVYIKGNLALNNFYQFAGEEIFGIKEGIIADYSGISVLIFKYRDTRESLRQFQYSREKLKCLSKFRIISSQGKKLVIQDDQKKIIGIKPYKDYLYIIISETQGKIGSFFRKLTEKINQIKKNP